MHIILPLDFRRESAKICPKIGLGPVSWSCLTEPAYWSVRPLDPLGDGFWTYNEVLLEAERQDKSPPVNGWKGDPTLKVGPPSSLCRAVNVKLSGDFRLLRHVHCTSMTRERCK